MNSSILKRDVERFTPARFVDQRSIVGREREGPIRVPSGRVVGHSSGKLGGCPQLGELNVSNVDSEIWPRPTERLAWVVTSTVDG